MSAIKVRLVPIGQGRTAVIDAGGQVLVSGTDGVVCRAARALIEQAADPRAKLEALRGDMVCLSGLLGDFAALTVREDDRGLRFAKWKPYDREA